VHHKIGITGDGVIQKIGDVWVMFYFGAFWEGRKDAVADSSGLDGSLLV